MKLLLNSNNTWGRVSFQDMGPIHHTGCPKLPSWVAGRKPSRKGRTSFWLAGKVECYSKSVCYTLPNKAGEYLIPAFQPSLSHPIFFFLFYFRERGREGERETST